MVTKFTQPTHYEMVDNIMDMWYGASASAHVDGAKWYTVAHNHARLLGSQYGVSTNTAALIIAVMSPQKSWRDNLTMAEQCLAGEHVPLATQATLRKADGVLNGVVYGLTAYKTHSFHELIRDGGNDFSVCVDTHAIIIAYGVRPCHGTLNAVFANTGGFYNNVAKAYIEAARRAHVPPHVMQATTWCARRESESTASQHGQSLIEVE